MNNNISREFIENKTHGFDPGGRAHWAKPRCKNCQEFEDHPIHDHDPRTPEQIKAWDEYLETK